MGGAGEEHRRRGVDQQHEEPEQQRPLLPAPERREAIGEAHGARRVGGDVLELEVAGGEGVEQHGHRHRDEGERDEDGALRDARPLAAPRDPGEHARCDSEQSRRAAPDGGRRSRGLPRSPPAARRRASRPAASNFEGHLASTLLALKRPSAWRRPSTTTSAPSLKRSGASRLRNVTGSAPSALPPAWGAVSCTAKRISWAADVALDRARRHVPVHPRGHVYAPRGAELAEGRVVAEGALFDARPGEPAEQQRHQRRPPEDLCALAQAAPSRPRGYRIAPSRVTDRVKRLRNQPVA